MCFFLCLAKQLRLVRIKSGILQGSSSVFSLILSMAFISTAVFGSG